MKKTTRLLIIIGVTLCLIFWIFIIKAFIGEKQYPPQITEHEFPFVVEYIMNDETYIVEDSVVCKFNGYDLSSLTLNKPRSWTSHLKSGNKEKCNILSEENQLSKIKKRQHNERANLNIYYGSPEYYMGDPDAWMLVHSEPQIIYYQTYDDHYNWGTELTLDEVEKYFGIKVTRFEFSEPIINYFEE